MRKFTGISLAIIAIALLIWKVSPYFKSNKNTLKKGQTAFLIKDNDEEMDGDEQDGIYEIQKHEFEITRDPALNIIPKNRLVTAYENIMARRQMQRPGDVSALSWTERGPNTDVTGPSNGNTRQGNGITSGRMRAILVDSGDASHHTVWVGGIAGGLWKTTNITNAPATWTLVSDNFSNMAVSAICQDPNNVNIIYFGTGEKTFNADAVKGGGVWKSTDHGLTWNLLPSTAAFYNVTKIVIDNTGNVYVATIGSGNGLMRSSDAGSTWTNIMPTGLSTRISEMELSTTGRMHIVVGYYNTAFASSGYRYTDNPATETGATWSSATVAFPNTQYNVDLAVAGNTLYALPANSAFQTPNVYKSIDGGDNWLVTAGDPTGVSSGQAWYNEAIAVDPANDQNVVVGGLDMFRTTNGGATWTKISNWVGAGLSYVHADQQTAVWIGNQVLVGSDGGIHYSNDGGATFTDRNTGLRIKQFYSIAMHPTNYNYFLAGAQDNGVHQLNAPGLSGSVEVTGGDGALVAIDQDQPQYQFGSYVFNQYRRSTDGGNTWSSVNYSGTIGLFINPFDYDNAGNKIYASGNANQYIRWENPQTGGTFTPISLTQLNSGKVSTVQVSPFTPKRVYFGSTVGKVVKVDNADGAFSLPTDITGSTMPAFNVSCVAVGTDDNNLLATYSNFGVAHVWVSTTGGGAAGWTDVSGNLPDIPVRWAVFYPEDNTKAFIATEAGVFETNQLNGAATVWTQNATFPFVRTDMLKYRAVDGTIAAATHGRGVWTAVIPKTIPYIRFASSLAGANETTTGIDGCRNFTDYTYNLNIDIAPTGNATLTLGVDVASSAKEGSDFDLTTNGSFLAPSKTIVFANGSTASQTFTVRIYDDAEVESTESFIINYTVSGTTNAVAAPSAKTLTYTITDNDKAPVQGGDASLYTIGAPTYYITFGTDGAPFNSQLQSRRSLTLYRASELSASGTPTGTITSIAYNMAKQSTRPYTNMLIKMGTTSVNYIVDGASEINNFSTTIVKTLASYSTVNGYNTFTLDNPFEWNGTDNIVIEICYDNLTAAPSELVDKTIGYADGGSNTQGNLYWQDNIACGTPFNTAFTNYYQQGIKPMIQMSVTRTGNPIATSGSNTIYIGGTGANYFYTGNNILASLSNQSANLGCVAASFIETGNVWQSYNGGMRSQKVFSIEPTTNLNSSYIVGLYYTTAELAGNSPANLKIAKTEAATVAGSDGSNTVTAATTYSAYREGYVFYAPFTSFSKFFLVDASVVLPVTLLSFEGALSGNNIQLNWKTSSERNSKYFELQKSGDGNSFVALGKINAAGTVSTERNYSFVDTRPSEINYYRLKMIDADGRSITSKTILIKNPDVTQHLWIGNNPFHNQLEVHLAKTPLKPIMIELISMNGAKVYSKIFGVATSINLDLSSSKISSGIYLLKTQVDGKIYTHKVIKE